MVGGFCRVVGLLCVNRSDQTVIVGKSAEWAAKEVLSEQRVSAPAQQPMAGSSGVIGKEKKEKKKEKTNLRQSNYRPSPIVSVLHTKG